MAVTATVLPVWESARVPRLLASCEISIQAQHILQSTPQMCQDSPKPMGLTRIPHSKVKKSQLSSHDKFY
jgi:hypothetical protein